MSLTLLSDNYSNYQPCRSCGFYVTPNDEVCPKCYEALPHQTTYEAYALARASKQHRSDLGNGLLSLIIILVIAAAAGFGFQSYLAGMAAIVVGYLTKSKDIDHLFTRKPAQIEQIDFKMIPPPKIKGDFAFKQSESILALEAWVSEVLVKTEHEIALGNAARANAKEISMHRKDAADQSERIAQIVDEIELEALQLRAYKLNIYLLNWKNDIEYIIYRGANVSDEAYKKQKQLSLTRNLGKSGWAREVLEAVIKNLVRIKVHGEEIYNGFEQIKNEMLARNGSMPVIDVYMENLMSYLKNVQDFMLDIRELLLKYQLTEMNNMRGDNLPEIIIAPPVEQSWKLDMVAEVKSLHDNVYETERQLELLAIKLADSPARIRQISNERYLNLILSLYHNSRK